MYVFCLYYLLFGLFNQIETKNVQHFGFVAKHVNVNMLFRKMKSHFPYLEASHIEIFQSSFDRTMAPRQTEVSW